MCKVFLRLKVAGQINTPASGNGTKETGLIGVVMPGVKAAGETILKGKIGLVGPGAKGIAQAVKLRIADSGSQSQSLRRRILLTIIADCGKLA